MVLFSPESNFFKLFMWAEDLSQIKSSQPEQIGEDLIRLKSSAPVKCSKISTLNSAVLEQKVLIFWPFLFFL